MRVNFNESTGEARILPENTEDLWHVERVLEQGDLVKARSWRRFKTGEGESGEKKPVNIELAAEQIEFHEHFNRLRVTGKIKAGTPEEFVQIGSYHTIDVEPGEKFSVIKQKWKKYQLDRLTQAVRETKRAKLAVVVIDDEKATLATIHGFGVRFVAEITSNARKRDEKYEQKQREYMDELYNKLKTYDSRIIVAGPGFTKDSLRKYISQKDSGLLKRISFENCSTSERSGVYELLKMGVVGKVMGEQRVELEVRLMGELMSHVAKNDGLATYGKKEVEEAGGYRAIAHLLVNDELLRKDKEVEKILESVEKTGAQITILNSEEQAGEQLASLGGIAALLRFQIK